MQKFIITIVMIFIVMYIIIECWLDHYGSLAYIILLLYLHNIKKRYKK